MAKFDCSIFRPICEGVGVEKYPSLVWMKNGKIIDHFKGHHDVESMKTYVFEMMRPKRTTIVRTALSPKIAERNETETSSESNSSEFIKKTKVTITSSATAASDIASPGTVNGKPSTISSTVKTFKPTTIIDNLKKNMTSSKEGVYIFTTTTSSEGDCPDSSPRKVQVTTKKTVKVTKKKSSSDDESDEDSETSDEKIIFTGLNSSSPGASHEVADILSSEKQSDKKTVKKVDESDEESEDKSEDTKEKSKDTKEESEDDEVSDESVTVKATKGTTRVVTTQKVMQVLKSSKFKAKYLELVPANFTKSLNANGVSFVMLYAPWCHFCDEMRDLLKLILIKHEKTSFITIGQMDCVNKDHEKFCTDQEMQGVPTMNVYRNGKLLLNDYQGNTFEELEDCILSHMTDEAIDKWEDREDEREKKRKAEKKKRQKEEKASMNSTTTKHA